MRDFKAVVREHVAPLRLPRDRELKIVDELAAQLEELHGTLVDQGLTHDEAWQEMQRQMPAWSSVARDLVAAQPIVIRPEASRRLLTRVVDAVTVGLWRDLHGGLRLLRRDRGFSATTILTLAACLGANAAIFTVVFSLLLRPLPVTEPDRLVVLGDVYPTLTPDDVISSTPGNYDDRRQALTTLEAQALFTAWTESVRIGDTAAELRGLRTMPSLFAVLGVKPALGRALSAADARPGSERRIVISYGLWQRLYGGDPAAVGRDLRLGWSGEPYTVVGVLPREFWFLAPDIDFWIPMVLSERERSDGARTQYGYYHIGRMREGTTPAQVAAQVATVNADLFERFPQFRLAELGMYTAVTPWQEAMTREVRRSLYLLWSAAGFVLLIGVINVANLSLARARVRVRELATRLALGAGRAGVVRQLAIEGLVLGMLGGVTGVFVGGVLLRGLAADMVTRFPAASTIAMDEVVIAATLGVAALVGVLIGAVPGAVSIGRDVSAALTDNTRGQTAGLGFRLVRRTLVVVQVAATVVLLVGAALLLSSFRNLLSVDPGFTADRVVTASIFPPVSRYPNLAAAAGLTKRVLDAARELPGVEAAGATTNIALSGRAGAMLVTAGDTAPGGDEAPVLPAVVSVTPGYFEALRIGLVRGRYFTAADRERPLPVAIVDERLAARLWPGADPIGKTIVRGRRTAGAPNPPPLVSVVGVVRTVRYDGLGEPAVVGAAYFIDTHSQIPLRRLWLAVRTTGDTAGVMTALQSAMNHIDPELPLTQLETMDDRKARSLVSERLALRLSTLFGGIALFLSTLGVYGVLAYLVAQRRREIGIRMALGSTVRRTFRLVFAEGLTVTMLGVALGVAGAVAVRDQLASLLFGITPTNPAVLATMATGAGIVALLACVWPAYLATRVDPLETLKNT